MVSRFLFQTHRVRCGTLQELRGVVLHGDMGTRQSSHSHISTEGSPCLPHGPQKTDVEVKQTITHRRFIRQYTLLYLLLFLCFQKCIPQWRGFHVVRVS